MAENPVSQKVVIGDYANQNIVKPNADGSINVVGTVGGGSAFGDTFPATGIAIGVIDGSGNMVALEEDGGGRLLVTDGTDTEIGSAVPSMGIMALGFDSLGDAGPFAIDNFGRVIVTAKAQYETVAASQTAQPLGSTGATGDYLSGLLIVPATTSPGAVALLDNVTSISVFTGGASSVGSLVPFFIPIGANSASGAWKVTTGADVSVIAIGNFT